MRLVDLARLRHPIAGARLSRCLHGSWFTLMVGYIQSQRPLGLRPYPQCLCCPLARQQLFSCAILRATAEPQAALASRLEVESSD